MSQSQVIILNKQQTNQSTITINSDHQTSSKRRQNQSKQMDDIFEAMQKNFDSTFNTKKQPEVPELTTQLFSTQPSKQSAPSSRSSRKVKPIYNSVSKKQQIHQAQSSHQQQNQNSSSEKQVENRQQLSASKINAKSPQVQHQQHSNKSSPYGKFIGKIHHTEANQLRQEKLDNKQSTQRTYNGVSPQKTSKSPKVLNYKELQQKIESALKKNSHYKAFGTTSRLSKSNFTTRTFNEFNQMLLNRFEEYEKRKQRQIEQKRLQTEERKQKELNFHPKINKKSLKFIQQMGGHQPIEHRYQKIIQAKNRKIQLHEQHKKQQDQQEYEQFMEEFLKHQKSPLQNTRSYDEFYEEMYKWKQRSKRNAQEKKKTMEENQIKQANNFIPKINNKSQKIVINSTKSLKHIPIYQRQIPSQKRYKCKIDEQCTFKPKINKRKIK